MNVDRLNRLADLLEQNADNPQGMKFDLRHWAYPDSAGPRSVGTNAFNKETPSVSCGTVGCALGLAAVSGIFAAEGLNYHMQPYQGGHGVLEPTYLAPGCAFKSYGFRAGEEFFDIDYTQARNLFSSEAYEVVVGAEAERAVAARIRELVKGGR